MHLIKSKFLQPLWSIYGLGVIIVDEHRSSTQFQIISSTLSVSDYLTQIDMVAFVCFFESLSVMRVCHGFLVWIWMQLSNMAVWLKVDDINGWKRMINSMWKSKWSIMSFILLLCFLFIYLLFLYGETNPFYRKKKTYFPSVSLDLPT